MRGLPDSDDLIEANLDFIAEQASGAVKERKEKDEYEDEEEEEEAFLKFEQQVDDAIYRAWQKSVEAALDAIEETTGVVLTPKWNKDEFDVGAKGGDWAKAARQLVEIINGVGLVSAGGSLKEAMQIEGVRTPRQFVLRLWSAVRDYPEVYGTSSHERIYERALEGYMRNI